MKKSRLALSDVREGRTAELAKMTDHRTLTAWALDCAERVLPHFESRYPLDERPRAAIRAGRAWTRTGVFRMAAIRKAALDSHASARSVEDDDSASSAARAAGQAVAAAHVPEHALAAAVYAATAVRDAAEPSDADAATARELEWQHRHLVELRDVKRRMARSRKP
jgi:hypothetical protein